MLVLSVVFGTLALALVFGLLYAHEATAELAGLIPVSVFAVGKFLPLWGITTQSNFSPWELGLVIWVLDTFTVLVVVYALEGLVRFAYLKRAIDRVQTNAHLVLVAYPRLRKVAVLGVVLFVMFPVTGTGAMAGAFLGILLGLHRAVLVAAVSAGGFLGGMTVAFLAVHFGEFLAKIEQAQESREAKWIGAAIILFLAALAFRWLGKTYRRALAEAVAATAPTSAPGEATESRPSGDSP